MYLQVSSPVIILLTCHFTKEKTNQSVNRDMQSQAICQAIANCNSSDFAELFVMADIITGLADSNTTTPSSDSLQSRFSLRSDSPTEPSKVVVTMYESDSLYDRLMFCKAASTGCCGSRTFTISDEDLTAWKTDIGHAVEVEEERDKASGFPGVHEGATVIRLEARNEDGTLGTMMDNSWIGTTHLADIMF